MKFAVVVLAVVAAASAQFPGQYNPGQYNPGQYNRNYNNQYNNRFQYSTPAPFRAFSTVAPTFAPVYSTPSPVPVIPAVIPKVSNLDARNANIVKYGNEINPDGSYAYYYETDNGIAAQEQGTPRNFGGNPPVVPDVAQGSYSYTSPEGVPVAISYIADENGFQPVGNVIPTPPPVPEQIARALAYIAKYAPQK